MQPRQNVEIPKTIIYTPFPKIEEEEEYLEFLSSAFQNTTGTKTINGLRLRYDSDANMANWEGYDKHAQELDQFKDLHIKRFLLMFREKNLNYQIIELNCPISLYNTEDSAEKIFSKYNGNDVFFINCHGNTDVIGTGGFVLTPAMLAQNLNALGLPKNDPPIIVVWSCNSGKEQSNCKSYAENLRVRLKSLKFENVCVLGVDAAINPHKRARKSGTMVTYEDRKEYEVLRIYASPSPKKQFIEVKGDEDALWTQITKIKNTRRSRNKEVNISKKINFDSMKSTKKEELHSNLVREPQTNPRTPRLPVSTSRVKRSGTQAYQGKYVDSSLDSSTSKSSEEDIFSPYKYQSKGSFSSYQKTSNNRISPPTSGKVMFSSRSKSLIEQTLHQETPLTVSVNAEKMTNSSFGQGSNTAKRLKKIL